MTKEMDQNSEKIATCIFCAEARGIDLGYTSTDELCSYIANDMGLKPYSVERVRRWLDIKYEAVRYR